MATIRNAGSKSVVDLFGAASAAATTLTDTTRTIGRVAQAGYAWTDAWADNIEANAEKKKEVAGAQAEDNAIAWLVEQRVAIIEKLDTIEKKTMFNELKDKFFK